MEEKKTLREDFLINECYFKNFINASPEEREIVRKWRNGDRIKKWMLNSNFITMEEHNDFIKALEEDEKNFYWIVSLKGIIIGIVDVKNADFTNKECSWGFYLNPKYINSGNGFILEYDLLSLLFDEFDFRCVKNETLTDNYKAIRLHEFFGFKKEEVLRDYLLDDNGHSRDLIIMSLLKKEWEENNSKLKKVISKFKGI